MNEKSCITINCGCCGNGSGNENGNGDIGFPGDEFIDITTPYTAVSNGYVYFRAMTKIANGGAGSLIVRSSNGMIAHSLTSFNNHGLYVHLPVKEGSVIEIDPVNATVLDARFYPAV